MRTNRIREKYTPYILLPMILAAPGANTVNKFLTVMARDTAQMALAGLMLAYLGILVCWRETGGRDWNYHLTPLNFWGVYVGMSTGVGGFTVFWREVMLRVLV